jgi:hypothetical protein
MVSSAVYGHPLMKKLQKHLTDHGCREMLSFLGNACQSNHLFFCFKAKEKNACIEAENILHSLRHI